MKLLILLLSSKQPHFVAQTNALKEEYSKLIDKHKLNNYISVYSYIGDANKKYIDNNTNTIYCTENDDVNHLYEKTIDAFEQISGNIEYDWIIRTNNSQFVNIQLLYEFFKNFADDNNIYTCGISSWPDVIVFNKFDLELNGNFMCFSKETINIIISLKNIPYELRKIKSNIGSFGDNLGYDDVVISLLLMYHYRTNDDFQNPDNYLTEYWKHVRIVEQGFYQCWDYNKPYEGTAVCKWHNENLDFNFIKNFMSMRTKSESERVKSNVEKLKAISNVYLSNTNNNVYETARMINDYSTNGHIHTGWWSNPIYRRASEIFDFNKKRINHTYETNSSIHNL